MSSKNKSDGEKRFYAFAKSLPGVECVDEMDLNPEQVAARKADVLFDHRRIVCELKSLKKDTGGKVERILAPHKERPEWPIFFGSVQVQQILKHLPDGDQIHRQIFDGITSAIKELVRSANGQIRRTKETFGLPSAGGMLVILNEFVDILSPSIIAHKIDELFRKKTPDGEPCFPEINAVWVINESHTQQLTPDLEGVPAIIMTNVVPDVMDVTGFIESLQPKWAAFHGVPLIRIQGNDLDNFNFRSRSRKPQESEMTISAAEMWRRQYRKRPYLRTLTKQELSDYFGRLLSAQAPGYLKGATETQESLSRELKEPWTHLLEEVNLRGLDMREFSAVVEPLKTTILDAVGTTSTSEVTSVTIKEDIQGPVSVEHHTRGATARINFYLLSLAASRVLGGTVYLDHAPSYAPAPINSVEEAYERGVQEAEERWPISEGWSHTIEVKPVKLTFEFGNKNS